jgi:phosphoglycolate phosphatase
MKRLCAFDFDGTLADSKTVYYKAVAAYALQNSLKAPLQEDMGLVFGNPNPPIVFNGWGGLEAFKSHLQKVYILTDDLICAQPSVMPLFEGIYELLDDLHQDGVVLSIVTSRSLKPIRSLMEHHKISPFFKTIRTDQDVIERGYRGKPHPDKLNCVLKEMACPAEKSAMIGDTLMDMAMAKSAGAKAIGVSWGYHDESMLRDYGADRVVHTPQELHQIIHQIL